MSINQPDVSVIICTLNEEKRIGNCLRHLQDQDFNGTYEIIVADGCSDDRTEEIAREMGVRVVLEKTRTIASERQAGGRAARGKLLLFTDADSSAPRDWISSVSKAFFRKAGTAYVYGPVFPSDGTRFSKLMASIGMPLFLRVFHGLRLFSPIGSNIAIRREVFEEIGGFNVDLITCEDLDLAKRARQHGGLMLDRRMRMYVSQRRVEAWGTWKFATFHLVNGIRYHLLGRSSSSYEDIR